MISEPSWAPLPTLRPIRGLGTAVVVLLGLWSAVELFVAVVDVLRVSLISRVLADPASVDPAALTVNDALDLAGLVVREALYVATVGVFLAWLFRARDNAERANDAGHRHGRLWLTLGWGVPVVSLWFPKQIVDDIWRASEPATPPAGDVAGGRRNPVLVYLWWVCWLPFWAANLLTGALSRAEGVAGLGALESVKASATVEIAAGPIGVATAALAALIVLRISAFQEARRTAGRSVATVPPGRLGATPAEL